MKIGAAETIVVRRNVNYAGLLAVYLVGNEVPIPHATVVAAEGAATKSIEPFGRIERYQTVCCGEGQESEEGEEGEKNRHWGWML